MFIILFSYISLVMCFILTPSTSMLSLLHLCMPECVDGGFQKQNFRLQSLKAHRYRATWLELCLEKSMLLQFAEEQGEYHDRRSSWLF